MYSGVPASFSTHMSDKAAAQSSPATHHSEETQELDSVAQYRSHISQMLGTKDLADNDPERHSQARESQWLKLIYEQNRALIHGDMDRGWGILQIFVPFSIGPFAALAAITKPGRPVLFALGAASALTLLAANLMVDRIKQHEKRTWDLVRAIEAEIGLDGLGEGWRLGGERLRGVRFRYVRWSLLLLVGLVWLALIATAS